MSETAGFGPYRKERLLGVGGMGQVWTAFDTRTSRRIALKLLPAHLAEDAEFRRRFLNEAALAANLNEPHIVPIHSWGDIDGQLYIDMALIEGRDLATILLEDGPMSCAAAIDLVTQVAEALDTAHYVGLTHRDVKPSNLLLTNRRGFVYLIDFGIAHGAEATRMTTAQSVIGSLAYMAPERFAGDFDARSDLYSLACVLYQCITGEPPFGNTAPERLIHDHLVAEPPRVRTIAPEVPAALDETIARGLAKRPEDRYESAGEFAAAASAALHAEPDVQDAVAKVGNSPQFVDSRGIAWPVTGLFLTMLAFFVLGECIRTSVRSDYGQALGVAVGLFGVATIAAVAVLRARRLSKRYAPEMQAVGVSALATYLFVGIADLADYRLQLWFAYATAFLIIGACAVGATLLSRRTAARTRARASNGGSSRPPTVRSTATIASPSSPTLAASVPRTRASLDGDNPREA